MLIALVGAITSTDSGVSFPSGVYQLGARTIVVDSVYGVRTWKYVYNAEAATAYAAGTVVMNQTATATPGRTLIAAAGVSAHRIEGVAQHAIPAQSWGWILAEGLGLVIADTGGFTVDTGLIPGNAVAGTADDAGATGAIFALALATTLATASGVCKIRCAL